MLRRFLQPTGPAHGPSAIQALRTIQPAQAGKVKSRLSGERKQEIHHRFHPHKRTDASSLRAALAARWNRAPRPLAMMLDAGARLTNNHARFGTVDPGSLHNKIDGFFVRWLHHQDSVVGRALNVLFPSGAEALIAASMALHGVCASIKSPGTLMALAHTWATSGNTNGAKDTDCFEAANRAQMRRGRLIEYTATTIKRTTFLAALGSLAAGSLELAVGFQLATRALFYAEWFGTVAAVGATHRQKLHDYHKERCIDELRHSTQKLRKEVIAIIDSVVEEFGTSPEHEMFQLALEFQNMEHAFTELKKDPKKPGRYATLRQAIAYAREQFETIETNYEETEDYASCNHDLLRVLVETRDIVDEQEPPSKAKAHFIKVVEKSIRHLETDNPHFEDAHVAEVIRFIREFMEQRDAELITAEERVKELSAKISLSKAPEQRSLFERLSPFGPHKPSGADKHKRRIERWQLIEDRQEAMLTHHRRVVTSLIRVQDMRAHTGTPLERLGQVVSSRSEPPKGEDVDQHLARLQEDFPPTAALNAAELSSSSLKAYRNTSRMVFFSVCLFTGAMHLADAGLLMPALQTGFGLLAPFDQGALQDLLVTIRGGISYPIVLSIILGAFAAWGGPIQMLKLHWEQRQADKDIQRKSPWYNTALSATSESLRAIELVLSGLSAPAKPLTSVLAALGLAAENRNHKKNVKKEQERLLG